MATFTKEHKELLQKKYIECATDITKMASYCTIRSNKDRNQSFKLYEFQERTLTALSKSDRSIILKARQMGISTLLALVAIHMMIFEDASLISIISNRQSTSEEVLKKVKLMFSTIPEWLLLGTTIEISNTKEFRLSNGSAIKAYSSASDAARSTSANLVIMDEAAFIPKFESVIKSVEPLIATGGGKIIILSTPNGTGDHFHKMWSEGESGKNGYLPIKLRWNLHPERDENWKQTQISALGKQAFAQEYDCEFMGSGHTVIDNEVLDYIDKNTVQDPIIKIGDSEEYWIWKYYQYGRKYAVIVDTAKGDGGDDSTIQVIDIEDNEQVAELDGQIPPKELARKAKEIATAYGDAILIVENTGIGYATVEELETIGYSNLYRVKKGSSNDDYNLYVNTYIDPSSLSTGFNMSWNVRPALISKLEYMLRYKSLVIRSRRTYNELCTFIWFNGKAQATRGCTDDLIMPLAIYSHLRDNILVHNNKANDLRRSALDNIKVYKHPELNSMMNGNYNLYQQDKLLKDMGFDPSKLF